MLLPLVLVIAAVVAISVPGIWVASRLFADRGLVERGIWGVVIGLSAAIFLSVATSYIRLELFYAVWLIFAVTAYLWRRRAADATLSPAPIDLWLIAILVAAFIPRLIVALAHDLPPGWDPTSHLVMARKILESRHAIHDWKPFEDVALNYPVGSHTLVAVIALATRLPVHTVFNLLMPVLGGLSVAAVFLLARAITGNAEIARYGTAAYGLLANWGSIDYYRWGGMPNMTGMIALTAALALVAGPRLDRPKQVIFGLLLAAMFLTHHHVSLTGACILTVWLVASFIIRDSLRRNAVIGGVVIAAVLDAFYAVPYVLKAGDIRQTPALDVENAMANSELVPDIGLALLILSMIGLAWLLAQRRTIRPDRMLWIGAVTLAVLFVTFEYVVSGLTAKPGAPGIFALAPTRFFTDLNYFLPVFAGYGVFALRRLLRVASPVALVATMAAGISLSGVWQRLYSIPTVGQPTWEAFTWIAEHTEPDAIVLAGGRWSVYGTWRRTLETSMQGSELVSTDSPKKRLMRALQAGDRPPDAAHTQVVTIRDHVDADAPGRVLWRHPSGLTVIELWPSGR